MIAAMEVCNLMAELEDNTFKAAEEEEEIVGKETVDNGLEDEKIEDAEMAEMEDDAAVEMREVEMGEGISVHPLAIGGGGIGGPHGASSGRAARAQGGEGSQSRECNRGGEGGGCCCEGGCDGGVGAGGRFCASQERGTPAQHLHNMQRPWLRGRAALRPAV